MEEFKIGNLMHFGFNVSVGMKMDGYSFNQSAIYSMVENFRQSEVYFIGLNMDRVMDAAEFSVDRIEIGTVDHVDKISSGNIRFSGKVAFKAKEWLDKGTAALYPEFEYLVEDGVNGGRVIYYACLTGIHFKRVPGRKDNISLR